MMDMENYPVRGYGKFLPPLIAKGYMDAFEIVLNRSTVMMYFEAGIAPAIENPKVRWWWLKPIYANLRNEQHHALDYAQIAPFQGGFEFNMSYSKPAAPWRLIRRFTLSQGKVWWSEFFSLDGKMYTPYSLGTIVRPTLEAYLATYLQRYGTAPDALAVLLLTMRTFAHLSTIELDFHIEEQRLTITTRDCPFCLNRSGWCLMLFGIVHGAIEWISGGLMGMGSAQEQLEVEAYLKHNHQVSILGAAYVRKPKPDDEHSYRL